MTRFPQTTTRLSKDNLEILFVCVNYRIGFPFRKLSNRAANAENVGQLTRMVLPTENSAGFALLPAANFPHEHYSDARTVAAGTASADPARDAERLSA